MKPRKTARQTTWHINDLSDGWELEIQFRVTLGSLLPRYARLNRTIFISSMAMFTVVALGIAWVVAQAWIWLGLYVATLAPLFAFLFTALMWPIRYSKGPIQPDFAYLRYVEGNRLETIRASLSTIDVPAGVFALHHLAKLELSQVDPELDLYSLTFWGDFEHGQVFRWPGVPEPVAVDIRNAILERIGPDSHDANGVRTDSDSASSEHAVHAVE